MTTHRPRTRRTRGYTLIKLLLTIAIVGILAISFGGGVGCRTGHSHEDGWSVGTLINVRLEGAIWERPAATLLHTGEMKGEDFALDDGLLEKARLLADRSARVRVRAIHRYVCWAWNYARCEIITALDEDPVQPTLLLNSTSDLLTVNGTLSNVPADAK